MPYPPCAFAMAPTVTDRRSSFLALLLLVHMALGLAAVDDLRVVHVTNFDCWIVASPQQVNALTTATDASVVRLMPVGVSVSEEVTDMASHLMESIFRLDILEAATGSSPPRGPPTYACVTLRWIHKPTTDGSTKRLKRSSTDDDNRKAGKGPGAPVAYASSRYYFFLQQKLIKYTEMVLTSYHYFEGGGAIGVAREGASGKPRRDRRCVTIQVLGDDPAVVDPVCVKHVIILPVMFFVDIDAQVFDGWKAMALQLLQVDATPTSVDQPPVLGFGLQHNAVLRAGGKIGDNNDHRPGHTMYFQRESRSLLNSGVLGMHVSLASTAFVFSRALELYLPKDGGDQKALQRATKYLHFVCSLRRSSKNFPDYEQELKRFTGSERSLSLLKKVDCDGFSVATWDKRKVNAGIIDGQREQLLVHHAHMAGDFKRHALVDVLKWRHVRQSNHSVGTKPLSANRIGLENEPCGSSLRFAEDVTSPPTRAALQYITECEGRLTKEAKAVISPAAMRARVRTILQTSVVASDGHMLIPLTTKPLPVKMTAPPPVITAEVPTTVDDVRESPTEATLLRPTAPSPSVSGGGLPSSPLLLLGSVVLLLMACFLRKRLR